jgi:GAF domain-containing protein
MEVKIEYKKAASGDKNDWLSNHTLTAEQFAQLIRNKIERARVYQRKEDKVFFD